MQSRAKLQFSIIYWGFGAFCGFAPITQWKVQCVSKSFAGNAALTPVTAAQFFLTLPQYPGGCRNSDNRIAGALMQFSTQPRTGNATLCFSSFWTHQPRTPLWRRKFHTIWMQQPGFCSPYTGQEGQLLISDTAFWLSSPTDFLSVSSPQGKFLSFGMCDIRTLDCSYDSRFVHQFAIY